MGVCKIAIQEPFSRTLLLRSAAADGPLLTRGMAIPSQDVACNFPGI